MEIKNGDIWQLGCHRLMCGDAKSTSDVKKLMNNEKADLILTDPPYNVNYKGKKCKRKEIKNDNLTLADFSIFLNESIKNMLDFSKEGAMFYIFMAFSSFKLLSDIAIKNGLKWSTTIIWVKNNFVLSWADYHQGYELIWYGWKSAKKRLHPVNTRNQSNVWYFNRQTSSKLHPTMKPINLLEKAILNSSDCNNIVLDLFGGSGSTLIACENTQRICYMMEIDPEYCNTILHRYLSTYGDKDVKKLN